MANLRNEEVCWHILQRIAFALLVTGGLVVLAGVSPAWPAEATATYTGGFSGTVFEGFNFVHETAFPTNIPVTGVFVLTADQHGGFTSGRLRYQKALGNNPSLECHYALTSGTYFVNSDETGGTQTSWTLEGGINCPATFTSQTIFVISDGGARLDWVGSNLGANTLQGPHSGTLVRR